MFGNNVKISEKLLIKELLTNGVLIAKYQTFFIF